METGKKMNICADGGGGLNRGQIGATGERSMAQANGQTAGGGGPRAEADSRTVPVSCFIV